MAAFSFLFSSRSALRSAASLSLSRACCGFSPMLVDVNHEGVLTLSDPLSSLVKVLWLGVLARWAFAGGFCILERFELGFSIVRHAEPSTAGSLSPASVEVDCTIFSFSFSFSLSFCFSCAERSLPASAMVSFDDLRTERHGDVVDDFPWSESSPSVADFGGVESRALVLSSEFRSRAAFHRGTAGGSVTFDSLLFSEAPVPVARSLAMTFLVDFNTDLHANPPGGPSSSSTFFALLSTVSVLFRAASLSSVSGNFSAERRALRHAGVAELSSVFSLAGARSAPSAPSELGSFLDELKALRHANIGVFSSVFSFARLREFVSAAPASKLGSFFAD
mmetsp:Transcript_13622/g.36570  ORF Transcript_13622/g.36570 Transcript_13622/m.36570 type:complete len:335 (-) Transcript_13622:1704-2708(-)